MTVLRIYEPPSPVLREIAQPVKGVDDDIRRILDDMLETMYDGEGIGLAATQVGIAKRLVTIDLKHHEGFDEPLYLVNPEIVAHSEETVMCMEGCLSLPGQYAEVERWSEITVDYLDYDGNKQTLKTDGLLADCIQHEIDHLNGVLFVDHLSKMKRDRLMKKLKKSQKNRGVV
jgi:peptide deformylase